jgi:tight adherence protein C
MRIWGALLGLGLGLGLLLVWFGVAQLRRPRLAERVAPFVRDAARGSRLLPEAGGARSFGLLGALMRPIVGDVAALIERVLGGARSVRRRLAALGTGQSLEAFRVEQVMWGVVGALLGAGGAAIVLLTRGQLDLLVALALVLVGLVTGVLGRDWWLSVAVKRREAAMMAEFPVVAELLALAVTAGEAPIGALERVSRLCAGELSRELSVALGQARAGEALPVALQALAERTTLEQLARFVDGVVIALERGTPLADVLRAQAADVREAGKRELLAAGGRRELAMMVPVVFLILPVTVLFALYPGLVHITLLTH